MKNISHLVIITLFFNITLQAQDVVLEIPLIPDYGNAFTTSCIIMMLKYYNSKISFHELLTILGTPPLQNYDAVDEWVKAQYNLRFKRYDNSTIQDIINFIDNGYPVMILQQFSIEKEISIYRIVMGYNLENKEFILTDPSMPGEVYRISFSLFQTLLELFLQNSQGWHSFFFWSVHPAYFKDDVILNIPFEPNHGQTCAASCMTMVLKHFALDITFEDVIHKIGMPPLIDYESFNQWINHEFDLKFERYDNCNLFDIIKCIDNGYPVIVPHQFTVDRALAHYRVVIGYNYNRNEFIIKDPSDSEKEKRMSFELFQELWDKVSHIHPAWPCNFLWLILPNSSNFLL